MSWRLGIRTRARTATPGRGRVLQRGPHHPATTAGQLTIDARVEVTPPARPCQLLGLLGDARPRLRHPRPPPRAGRRGTSIVETPPSPRPTARPTRRLGRRSTTTTVATAFYEYLAPTDARRRTTTSMRSADASASERADAARGARARRRLGASRSRLRAGQHERLDVGDRGVEGRARRVPGLRPPGASRCCASMGIPARYVSGTSTPTPTRRSATTVHGESHAWVEAWTGELAAVRPDQRRGRRASATCSSPGAATTATSRR